MEEEIEKYFLGEMDLTERLTFLKRVESDPEWQRQFAHYQNTNALLALSEGVVMDNKQDAHHGYDAFQKQMKQHAVRTFMMRMMRYAAVVAVLVFSIYYYHIYMNKSEAPVVSDVSLLVPAGQRINLTLADGTKIWLNSQTRITYPTAFVGAQRHVSIEGEAYFEVAKDTEKPFIVSSYDVDMEVLGTEFNVYSYPDEGLTRVSLLEGSLQVYDPASPATKIRMEPNQEVIIRGHRMEKVDIPYLDYFLWTEGILCFNREPLSSILKRLEIYFDIRFEVKDPSILAWEYTVKFRQRDGIDEILRLMQRIHAFKVVKDEANNTIVLSKL